MEILSRVKSAIIKAQRIDYLSAAQFARAATLRAQKACDEMARKVTDANEHVYVGLAKELCAIAKEQADIAQRIYVDAVVAGDENLSEIAEIAVKSRATSASVSASASIVFSQSTWWGHANNKEAY